MKNAVKSFQVPSQYELIAFIAFNTIRNIVEIKLINKVFDAFSNVLFQLDLKGFQDLRFYI